MSRDACRHGKYRHMETCSICDARDDWKEGLADVRSELRDWISSLEDRVKDLESRQENP